MTRDRRPGCGDGRGCWPPVLVRAACAWRSRRWARPWWPGTGPRPPPTWPRSLARCGPGRRGRGVRAGGRDRRGQRGPARRAAAVDGLDVVGHGGRWPGRTGRARRVRPARRPAPGRWDRASRPPLGGRSRDSAALRQLAQDASRTRTAPGLSSGLLPLPHLGDWTQDGQPASQPHSAIAVPGGARASRRPRRRPARRSRRRRGGRRRRRPSARSVSGCSGGGEAADVPAVAGGDQRQQADRGVLGGVQGARARPAGRRRRPSAPAARRSTRPRRCAGAGAAGPAGGCR